MGERTNGVWMNVLGWTATIAMFAAAIGLMVNLPVRGPANYALFLPAPFT